MRDLRVAPGVAALLPPGLAGELTAGPHPSRFACPVCLGEGDLAGGESASLALRRYPLRGLRRVQLLHAACGASAVTVAPPWLAERELGSGRSVVYADVVAQGLAVLVGCRPGPVLVVDDDDDLVTTDPVSARDPAVLLAGEIVTPVLGDALAAGLGLLTRLCDEAPPVPGWSVRAGHDQLDIVRPRDAGPPPHRLPRRVPAPWTEAVRGAGDQVTLLVGRIGLSTALRVPARPVPRARAPQAPPGALSAAALFALAAAAGLGRVAAGRVGVTWTPPA